MTPKRLTTSDRVNQLLSKDEPTYEGIVEMDKIQICLSLNWYSQNKDKDDAYKYLQAYCKQNTIKVSAEQLAMQVTTLGYVCRMIMRGALLDNSSLKWVDAKIQQMIRLSKQTKEVDTGNAPAMDTPHKTVSIQDRLKKKASQCIGDLEGAIDSFILSDFKKMPNTLEIMRQHDVKGVHGPSIVNHFKKDRDEFRVAITEKDKEVNEAYSNYTLVQMKKMESAYDQIISDALKVMGEATANRAPRAKKPKTPEAQVKSLKFCSEDSTLNLKSVSPVKLIGAEMLWSYHVPSRMLTQYVADDASGLGAKGSAILNYSKTKTRTKKLRKPEDILPKVVSGGKVFLKNLMNDLTTKDAKVTGRVNSQTILLRVVV